jgi:hypothetical protein
VRLEVRARANQLQAPLEPHAPIIRVREEC